MRTIIAAIALTMGASIALADIQCPPRPGPVRKLGSGIAKIAYSSAYFVDSIYKVTNEGVLPSLLRPRRWDRQDRHVTALGTPRPHHDPAVRAFNSSTTCLPPT
jgi:hypothetical protein